MTISVADILKLPSFYGAQILAGSGGLDRQVAKVTVMECPEFPLDPEVAGLKDNLLFRGGDFFITSLYALKDSPQMFYDTVKLYDSYNSSGMCIIRRYYESLPEDIANLANELNFPIIMVNRNTAYADMIHDITRAILSIDYYHIAISIINDIRSEENRENIVSLAYTLNNKIKNNLIVFCLKTEGLNDDKLKYLSTNINSIEDSFNVQYYNKLMIFISSDVKFTDDAIEKHISKYVYIIEKYFANNYSLGVSNYYDNLKCVKECIEEALISCKVSSVVRGNIMQYKDIGTYKILLDINNRATLEKFYDEIMKPLEEYDEIRSGRLKETLLNYVKNDGDINRTAEDLFQHQNTIRYRVNRVKQLLGFEEENIRFFENISLAYKIHNIINNE